jgi:hypothetical protein
MGGSLTGMRVCMGDDDWFAIELASDDLLSVSVRFTRADADAHARLAVHEPGGTLLAIARSIGGEARIGELRASRAGRHLVRIFTQGALAEDTFEYGLQAIVGSRACGDFEPSLDRARASGAPPLEPAQTFSLAAGADRYFVLELGVGETLHAALDADRSEDTFDLALFEASGDMIVPKPPLAVRASGRARLTYGPTNRVEPLWLRATNGSTGASTIVLSATRVIASSRREGRATGIARYEDRTAAPDGLGPPAPTPIVSALVEVARESDDYVVGTSVTDASGRYDARYVDYGDGPLTVRVLSDRKGELVPARVRRASSCPAIYAIGAPLRPIAPPIVRDAPAPAVLPSAFVELLAHSSDVGGAFNLLSVAGAAFDFLRPMGVPSVTRPLDFFWERGRTYDCGSCHESGRVLVGGGAADPDEYDDMVILHEIGHFYEETWGRTDSPGGPHNGARVVPPLAWSEGFATFFAAAVVRSPLYVDLRDTEAFVLDIEHLSRRETIGTEGARLDGSLSEYLVAAVLWDLFDAADASEGFDVAAYAAADLLRPTRDYFRAASFTDRAFPGVDLVDYLDGWLCLGARSRERLAPLLESRAFPYDFAGPSTCAPQPKPRPAVRLELLATPMGPSGLLRIRARATAKRSEGTLRVTLRVPPSWRVEMDPMAPPVVRAPGSGPTPARIDRLRHSAREGDTIELEAFVTPDTQSIGALTAAAVVEGPAAQRAAVEESWPRGVRRALLRGRRARSHAGDPLHVVTR